MNRTISALLCCALTLALAGCQEQVEEPLLDTAVTVETAAAQTGDLSTQSTYIGTISAEGTASVVALVSGNVEQVAVSVGDAVSAGDFLCRIDDESARLSLQNAQAAVNSAQESYNSALANYGGANLPVLQEQLRLAQDNYDDTQALMEIGAASQAEVDQAYQALLSAQAGLDAARASLNSAQAGIQSAQVGVESAQYQLSLYNLTSPISGVVEAVNVTENNFTASGTAAFVISNGSNKTVTFYVTDSVRQTLTPGQAVTVNYNGQTYEGAVTEIGGVVKNVLAIAVGASDGFGFGDNTRAALITRGLAEMVRLGLKMGAKPQTLSGLAGIGDLIVTCTSKHSRNHTVGERLGRGESIADILASMQMVAEGVDNARLLHDLAQEYGVEMPIAEVVYRICHQGLPAKDAVLLLMERAAKPE